MTQWLMRVEGECRMLVINIVCVRRGEERGEKGRGGEGREGEEKRGEEKGREGKGGEGRGEVGGEAR